jgi:hypothetical protein
MNASEREPEIEVVGEIPDAAFDALAALLVDNYLAEMEADE